MPVGSSKLLQMDPGELDQRVTIEKESLSGETISWTNISTDPTVWARIRAVGRGSDRYYADRIEGKVSHIITIWYRSDLTSKNRIVLGSRIFRIIGPPVNVEEADLLTEMLVEERVSDS